MSTEQEASRQDPALQYALRVLSMGDCSERKLWEKLLRKGFSQAESAVVLETVVAKGLIREQSQAQALAEYLCQRMWYGKRRITQTLLQKGYTSDTVNGLDFDEMDFVAACRNRLERACGRVLSAWREATGQEKRGVEQKLYQGCLRYGFSFSEIREALEEIAQEA